MRVFSSSALRRSCCIAALALVLGAGRAAGESATATVSVRAEFGARTALRLSSDVLRFDVASPTEEALAVVDFSAAARTRSGGEVVLSVEPLGTRGPGGAADVETSVSFRGDASGVLSGDLQSAAPTAAARWQGSGVRQGRLTFALRAAAAGQYEVPVRFVLSTP